MSSLLVDQAFQLELVQMAQLRLSQRKSASPVTRQEISETLDRLFSAFPEWKSATSSTAAMSQLEMIFSTFIGDASILQAEDGHLPWLKDTRDSISWRYWERYRALLIRQQLPQSAINFLDRITDRIIDLCGDPTKKSRFDRRGMVVGDVQSGKTANYTGLICKAADAGYKVIIVLAGMNNNLRSQTQIRLDEGFIGKISVPIGENASRIVGAGQIDPSAIVDWGTNRTEKGDFNSKTMSQFGIHPGGHPLLLVVKKNVSVLNSVLEWIDVTANTVEHGVKRFRNMPLLVIDDEADNASVDTRAQKFVNGIADSNHKPTAINSRIRQIVNRFHQVSYVAYTATPFANIFIHPDAETQKEFQDLFPRDFIVSMPVPDNYVGATRIFGSTDEYAEDGVTGLPDLLRAVEDHAASSSRKENQGWMPPVHKVDHVPLYNGQDAIPPSLRRAVQCFMLVIAARRERGQMHVHNSMLVHVTRFRAVQRRVIQQVQETLDQLANEIRYGGASGLDEFRILWETEFERVTRKLDLDDCPPVDWDNLARSLRATATSISVREINGSSGDVLDYDVNKEQGLNVIAVGGDKLARGLTLEGLSVTYFLRGSTMYDTLMQMGRWFGYRRGYLDLCRLFTTQDHIDWYGHIAQASDELRREFDRMEATGATPGQFGLRVRKHPALTVTSRAKMRHGTELQVSYAGDISETTVFSLNRSTLEQNYRVAKTLIERLMSSGAEHTSDPFQPRPGNRIHRWKNSQVWTGVTPEHVLAFLDNFSTHEDAARANTAVLAKYIRTQNTKGELVNWRVLLVGGEGEEQAEFGAVSVPTVVRQPKGGYGADATKLRVIGEDGRYVIRRLVNPRDEAVDLDDDAYAAAFRQTLSNPPKRRRKTDKDPDAPSGVYLRQQRSPRDGLLMIYPLARSQEVLAAGDRPIDHKFLDVEQGPIGLAISFPESTNAGSVTYMVNSLYGVGEDDEGDT
ncbi:hypothetical protein EHI46_24175 [Rhizobium leguminosarum]|uniref:Z1 domain-containing protein n=1 Tax=Rhizobium leguminosarum TaxID=384 RepID=UPI000FECFFD3|nr:Z1 domain-containing protein [Rhizobium leguminosarum]RWY68522.1 hypothetical protein EHI46_24175 [Rhizobium leguminosarum]